MFAAAPALAGQPETLTGTIRMTDGDTLRMGDLRIRLTGIDAPESDQPCRTEQGTTWACGAWVSARAAALFDGRQATCRTEGTDAYGRTLARCSVDGRDIGAVMVGQGYAFAYRKYSLDYVDTEEAARRRDAGLWAMQVQSPAQWRKARRIARAELPPDPACAIKGNISRKGKHIYHMPDQAYYIDTRITPSRGERWFCSEQEARAAGWRKSRS